LYSKQQIIISINSHDSNYLNHIMNDHYKWIVDELNANIQKNILNALDSDLNDEIISILKDKFNFSLHIDNNYKIIKKSSDYLWIGRGYPYRWIIINKLNNINSDNYWPIIKSTLEMTIDKLNIKDKFKKNIKHKNMYRGIYDYDISDTGGPFFTYVFENNIDNEVILISGFVSNPGKDKYQLLNQLETIITKTKVNINE